MFSKKGAHSLNNARTGYSLPREVIVANPNTIVPNSERPERTEELDKDIRDFKVFLKKNLAFEKPAPDLLVKIHQRIDAIKINE
jgi:hypothetical protein